ncbi:MAG TPA: class I SAM-dependent methyltransferase [Terriglobales bacterium]|nr:class I SAM-dependent methyltransferase [Terriglobales bacterium]
MTSAAQLAIEHWDKTPLYISEEERYGTYPWLPQAAEFHQHRGERVLEIGCGTGCDLLQFAKHGADATGVDITPAHLELARQRVGNLARVTEADARKLPFPDCHFDYIYSHGVLHHSDEPRTIVNEIFRALRPGGGFNVQVYSLCSYFSLWTILRYGKDWKLWVENSRDPVHIDLYTGRSLRRLFAPAKLEITKYQCKPFESLAPLFGWFLVAKGIKP